MIEEHANAPAIVPIGERRYVLQKLPAIRAMSMQLRIVKLLAPIGSEAEVLFSDDLAGLLADRVKLVETISAIVPLIDEELLEKLIVELCATATRDGEPLVFDIEFANDLIPAYQLALHAFQFNFSKYLNALRPSTTATSGREKAGVISTG